MAQGLLSTYRIDDQGLWALSQSTQLHREPNYSGNIPKLINHSAQLCLVAEPYHLRADVVCKWTVHFIEILDACVVNHLYDIYS
jgi:hypothetical protein